MPVVDGREYRSIDMTNFTVRDADEDGAMIVEGYATTFGNAYELYDGFYESIDRSALDGADMSDVIFLVDHRGSVLARQRNNTLSVMCDDHGLLVRADLSKCQGGREAYESIKNGLIYSMSWSFKVAEGGWDYDPNTRTSTVRKVAKVYDVSAVTFPANDQTEISARGYLDGVIEGQHEQELLARAQDADRRERLAILLSL